jgi:hypothetical protein
MSAARYTILTLLLGLLASCAPAVEAEVGGPLVALINAPAEQRVSQVAGLLQERTARVPGCCPFSFTRPQPVRFQETHRNMFGSRAVPQAASLARNLRADLAVMAGAARFERNVEQLDGERLVEGVVQLRATVIDASSEENLGSVLSRTLSGSRVIGPDESLPEPEEDPTMVALTEEAVVDLAPHLAALLIELSSGRASAAEGRNSASFASGSSSGLSPDTLAEYDLH